LTGIIRVQMDRKHKVIIRRCPDYDDLDRIRGIVAEGMEELGARPRVLEALVDVMAARPEVEKIILGERTGVYVPTRYHFQQAPYAFLKKKPKVDICFFDEDKLVEVELTKGGFHIRGCPVGIPIFTVLAPYFLGIPSPLLGEPPSQAFHFPAQALISYLHKFNNRVLP
jgi:hypothetical protein